MLGGTALWWFGLRQGVPLVGVDRKRNIALLRTKGGNLVAATQDEEGRVFLFDKAGNLYYDTEDPKLGMYIVRTAAHPACVWLCAAPAPGAGSAG